MFVSRRELNAGTNASTDRELILTQTNVKLDQEMPCYFDTQKLNAEVCTFRGYQGFRFYIAEGKIITFNP